MGLFSKLLSLFTKKKSIDVQSDTPLVSSSTPEKDQQDVSVTPKKTHVGVLGEYVRKFESGSNGSLDISWDSTGGTSYGMYQLAAKTKVFTDFIRYIKNSTLPNKETVLSLMQSVPEWDVGKDFKGTTAYNVWRDMAKRNLIQPFEHGFIKQERYDKALSFFPEDMQLLINSDRGFQEMLWSTVVQHGAGSPKSKAGAYAIFTKCWDIHITKAQYVSAVYADRGTRFKSSTAQVRQAVLNRFKEEEQIIQRLINVPGIVEE